jgi:hypothetical protein
MIFWAVKLVSLEIGPVSPFGLKLSKRAGLNSRSHIITGRFAWARDPTPNCLGLGLCFIANFLVKQLLWKAAFGFVFWLWRPKEGESPQLQLRGLTSTGAYNQEAAPTRPL